MAVGEAWRRAQARGEPVYGLNPISTEKIKRNRPDTAIQEQRDGPVPAPSRVLGGDSPGLMTENRCAPSRDLLAGQKLAPGDSEPIPQAIRKPYRGSDSPIDSNLMEPHFSDIPKTHLVLPMLSHLSRLRAREIRSPPANDTGPYHEGKS
jgi:hypothetical protein